MRHRTAVLVVFGALAVGQTVAAQNLAVLITEPRAGVAAFGEVQFAAEVGGDEAIEEVQFFVDGSRVARFTKPPYQTRIDLGQSNVEHRFEVVARDVSGASERDVLVTPKIRVDLALDLELQQLYITVSRDGRRVLSLERDDFTIVDDGEPQTIVTFEGGDVPLAAILLLDASLSMRGRRLQAVLEGAKAFVAGMQELDEASLMLFSDRLRAQTDFLNDPAILAAALAGVTAGGGTALNDHLYLALSQLEQRQGRRVVILLSDGVDLHSILRMESVLYKARRSQALIYWIAVAPQGRSSIPGEPVKRFSSWRNAQANQREHQLLAATVDESGGRRVPLSDIENVAAAFEEILSELREQFVLGYYPSQSRHDGSWHRVRVEVAHPGLKVRTRDGYLDY